MKRYLQLCIIACSLAIGSLVPVGAAVPAFDLATPQGIKAWELRTPATDTLALSQKYATDGKLALEFTTPKFYTGMQEWPAFEAKPLVSDWSGFDRLVVDITNPTGNIPSLVATASDNNIPTPHGLYYECMQMPAYGFRRYVIPLTKFPAEIDRKNISVVHFFLGTPALYGDLKIYVSNISLLKPGEPEPPITSGYLAQIRPFLREYPLKKARTALAECRVVCADKKQTVGLGKRYSSLAALLDAGNISSADISGFMDNANILTRDCRRVSSIESLRNAQKNLGIPTDTMLVGFVPSTEKVLPRDVPSDLRASRKVSISASRNEWESFQVAVTPSGKNTLKGVKVAVSDLLAGNGDRLAKSNINCDVVGYVQLKKSSPYLGWWPDPILNFLGPVDVKPGDVQTFWVRVRIPKEQKPGVYKGKLTVYADGKPISVALSVKVRSFKLPDFSPMPTAVTVLGHCDSPGYLEKMGGLEYWNRTLKYTWADFSVDYKIGYDDLYAEKPADWDLIKYLHDKGELVSFDLGNFFDWPNTNLKPSYDKCKELGLLPYAYVYGFDEALKPEEFQALETATQTVKSALPGVLVMTTAQDHTYGRDTVAKSPDAWAPLTPYFDMQRAAAVRAEGKKVWWYVCCGPDLPYANLLIQRDAIEPRLLLGAMSAKYRPDGFLYYETTLWNDNKPMDSGPYTNWDARTNGDGNLIYLGPKGMPVPTIRLENYRDGMEDFAYAKILEDIIGKYEANGKTLTASQRKWLTRAKAALSVPETLVTSMTEYSRSSKAVYAWRERVADCIDSSVMADADPWGKDFTVRGFANKR